MGCTDAYRSLDSCFFCQVSYTGCTKSPSNPTSTDAWVAQVATDLTDLSCLFSPILRWTRMKQTIVPGVDQLMTWHAKVSFVLNQPVVDVYNCEPSSYQHSSQSLVSCVCVMGWLTELHYAFGEYACVFKFFLVHIWRGNRGGNKLKDKLNHDPWVSGKTGP